MNCLSSCNFHILITREYIVWMFTEGFSLHILGSLWDDETIIKQESQ
jgi:hypothetical protein